MRRIRLEGTDIETSVLGFGCAALTSLNDPGRAERVLAAAFENGITHFDVARSYGMGHAEAIVGDFTRHRRDQVTITTKFGISPPAGVAANATLISMAKRVLKRLPGLAAYARRRAGSMMQTSNFSPGAAANSLEQSLRSLRTEMIDIVLLHEATLQDAAAPDLIDFLDRQIERGTLRAVGIGSGLERVGPDLTMLPAAYRVVQLANHAANPSLARLQGVRDRALITHSAMQPLGALTRSAEERGEVFEAHSRLVGMDFRDPRVLARCLLCWAVAENPSGVVLVGTTSPEHIAANRQAVDSVTGEQLDRFSMLVREVLQPESISSA